MVDVFRKKARGGAWGAVLALSAVATAARGWAAPAPPEVPVTRAEDRAIFTVSASCTRTSSAGFPSSRVGDWHSVAIRVADGGDCYFSVFYDVRRGTFSHLVTNGEA